MINNLSALSCLKLYAASFIWLSACISLLCYKANVHYLFIQLVNNHVISFNIKIMTKEVLWCNWQGRERINSAGQYCGAGLHI